jgi:N-acetylmuramoyl-L-alanine amidase
MPQAGKAKRSPAKYKIFGLTMIVLVMTAALLGLKLFIPGQPPIIKINQPSAQVTPSPTPTRNSTQLLVGLVAGHKGYDPGAVCDDGLTEGEVNEAVAREVVNLLERRDIRADLLDEFDPRLKEYRADALVSIHADSCAIHGATGFKVARVTDSAIPQAEDALVACLIKEYAIYTGLPQHPASITDNMTDYHAFREIASTTPGAIIETGFLLDDRDLLEKRPKIVARGIAAGILCFLDTR